LPGLAKSGIDYYPTVVPMFSEKRHILVNGYTLLIKILLAHDILNLLLNFTVEAGVLCWFLKDCFKISYLMTILLVLLGIIMNDFHTYMRMTVFYLHCSLIILFIFA